MQNNTQILNIYAPFYILWPVCIRWILFRMCEKYLWHNWSQKQKANRLELNELLRIFNYTVYRKIDFINCTVILTHKRAQFLLVIRGKTTTTKTTTQFSRMRDVRILVMADSDENWLTFFWMLELFLFGLDASSFVLFLISLVFQLLRRHFFFHTPWLNRQASVSHRLFFHFISLSIKREMIRFKLNSKWKTR